MNKPAMRDAALLILRFVIGVVFIAHGLDKLLFTGMVETTGFLSAQGIPQAQISAYLLMLMEILGGAALAVGFLTTFAAGGLMLVALGAAYVVHLDNGLFVSDGGVEFVLVLAASLFVLMVFGPGRASVDGVLTSD